MVLVFAKLDGSSQSPSPSNLVSKYGSGLSFNISPHIHSSHYSYYINYLIEMFSHQ